MARRYVIKQAILGLRQRYPGSRIWAIFEPDVYKRQLPVLDETGRLPRRV